MSAGRRANLSLATDGPDDRVTTGKAFTYAFTVTNEGPARATGVRFEGRLSATLELLSAEASQGRCRPGCEATLCELGAFGYPDLLETESVLETTVLP